MKKFLIMFFMTMTMFQAVAQAEEAPKPKPLTIEKNEKIIKQELKKEVKLDVQDAKQLPQSVTQKPIIIENQAPKKTFIQPVTNENYSPDKPTLQLNLKEIKSLPQSIKNINSQEQPNSLAAYTEYFEYPYTDVFESTLAAIEKSPFNIASFDTKSGRIFCNYKGTKPIYVFVAPVNNKTSIVRITPADGVYNIPLEMAKRIFSDIFQDLLKK